MGIATYSYNRSTSGGEIITHLINSTDGAGLHFDGTSGNIDIASPPDLGAFAVYINNGAGYPTTTTTITVDPLLAEIPAGTVLTFREGGEFIVTTAATPTAVSLVSTSGLTGAAVVDNEGAAFGGANKFSFEFVVQADEWGSVQHNIIDFGTGGRFAFASNSSMSWNLGIYDNSSWKSLGVKVLDDLKVHHLTLTVDGTAAILYDNGNQVGAATISASHGIDGCTDASIGSVYSGSGDYFSGNIFRTRFWNKTLSQTDVTSVYESASLDFADQWGSQISLVDAAASVFTSGTYSWTANPNNTIANVANALVITYVDDHRGAYNYLRNASDLTTDLTVGKKYRLTVDAKYTGGSSGARLKINDGVNDTYSSALTTSLVNYEIEFTAQSAAGGYLQLDSMAASNVVTVDNWYVREIGCVSDFDFSYANPTQSNIVRNRSDAGDGTAAGGVVQITPIDQLNVDKLSVGGTTPLVGIGLAAGTAPDHLLHMANVDGGSLLKLQRTEGNDGIASFNIGGGDPGFNLVVSGTSGDFTVATGGAERMRIDSTGNVGVGGAPTSPSSVARYLYVGDTSSAGIVLDDTNSTPWEIYNIQGSLYFAPNGAAAKVTLASSGLATFSAGIAFSGQTNAAGTGITSGATTMNHYEEGTWTAVLKEGTTAITLSSDGMVYVRVGKTVTVAGYFTINDASIGSGALSIEGLPFAMNNTPPDARNWANFNVQDQHDDGFNSGGAPVMAYANYGASIIHLTKNAYGGAGAVALIGSEVQDTQQIRLSGTYIAA